jgi:hypothetical protein
MAEGHRGDGVGQSLPREVDTARGRHTTCARREVHCRGPGLEWEVGMNCQHMGCRCQAEQGEEFCGDYCREHSGDAVHEEHMCECGHDACTMAAV